MVICPLLQVAGPLCQTAEGAAVCACLVDLGMVDMFRGSEFVSLLLCWTLHVQLLST